MLGSAAEPVAQSLESLRPFLLVGRYAVRAARCAAFDELRFHHGQGIDLAFDHVVDRHHDVRAERRRHLKLSNENRNTGVLVM
jgi:hypothetical protein